VRHKFNRSCRVILTIVGAALEDNFVGYTKIASLKVLPKGQSFHLAKSDFDKRLRVAVLAGIYVGSVVEMLYEATGDRAEPKAPKQEVANEAQMFERVLLSTCGEPAEPCRSKPRVPKPEMTHEAQVIERSREYQNRK